MARQCCNQEQVGMIQKYWKLFTVIATVIAGAFGINLVNGPGEIATVLDSMDRDLQVIEKNIPGEVIPEVPVLDEKGKVEVKVEVQPVKKEGVETKPASDIDLHEGSPVVEPTSSDVSSTAGAHELIQVGKLEVLDPAYSLDRQGLSVAVEVGRKNHASVEQVLAMLNGVSAGSKEWPEL